MTLPPASHPNARVLAVDDEPANLHVLKRILTGAGYRSVQTVTDSRAVTPRVAEGGVDLLLLDLHMPHVDGFAVMRQMAELPAARVPPVLVLTGDLSPEARRRALAGGARDFVTKPFDPVEAVLRVQNVLDVHFLQRRLQAQNQQLEQQLQHAGRLEVIGRLTSGIAHDFNNLLTVARGNAELLLGQLNPGTPEHGDADEIIRALNVAGALTRRLLGFTRINAVQPQRVELNATLHEALHLSGRLIGSAVTVRKEFWPGPLAVVADPRQIDQVVMNLAGNARDAMAGGGTLTVGTELRDVAKAQDGGGFRIAPGSYAVVRFADTGEGIAPEARERIFDPFFTTKAEGKGTGLGLSIVYGIVKHSGGYIWVDSETGQGTTFTLYLPLAGPEDPPGEAPSGG
ncbi:MAG: response regulator [Gemmatimonadetes bacterium]|nr:response regulator [Gemmatimonadota bacterium]